MYSLLPKITTTILEAYIRSLPATSASLQERPLVVILNNIFTRNYADIKKSVKVSGSGSRVKEFPVETDTHRLINYCCGSNYFQEGEDIKLKPENEYPDWLWELRTGPAPKLEELDPNTKDYWYVVRTLERRRRNRLHRLKTKILRQF